MIKTPFSLIQNEECFLNKGYFLFSLLNIDDLDFVRNIYYNANENNKLSTQQYYGVNYSLGTLTAQENNLIMEPIVELLKEKLKTIFSNYEILGCVFITKPANTKTTFVYHQDWCYTNEKNHAFVTCWVPLIDTNIDNGCMSLVAGSHKFFDTYRSDTLYSARIDFEEIPEEMRTNIEQQAGSCFAFHQAVFHGSYPNKSSNSRPVLAFIVKHKESPVIHYVKEESNLIAYELSLQSFNKMLNEIPKSKMPIDAKKLYSKPLHQNIPSAKDIVYNWRTNNKYHKLLKDEEQNCIFQKNGYLILHNAFSKDLIKSLREYYHRNFTTSAGMYVTHHNETNVEKNKEVSDFIFRQLNETLNNYFINYKSIIAHFAVKKFGDDGVFNLHQDWSIVKEQLFGVLHIWIPLQHTSTLNGTLSLIPFSHLLFQNYRSGTFPIHFVPFSEVSSTVIDIDAQEGDVVLYHPALFHGSKANYSKDERLAVVAAITHKNAERVYFHNKDNEAWVYELTDEDLFGRLDNLASGMLPTGKCNEKTYYRKLNDSEFVLASKLNKKINIEL